MLKSIKLKVWLSNMNSFVRKGGSICLFCRNTASLRSSMQKFHLLILNIFSYTSSVWQHEILPGFVFPLNSCLLSWQVSSVIHETRALDINTQVLFPLGETAAAIRGENELWLAMVLRNKILLDLKPAELAAVCGGLVSEGIKVRPSKDSRYFKVLAPLSLGSYGRDWPSYLTTSSLTSLP